MEKYLILVKHSLPEIEAGVPARDWQLSAEGRERAGRLARYLRPYHPEVIVSSKEPKAKATAEIAAAEFGKKPHLFNGLHEHDRSDIAYLSRDKFQESVRTFFENPNMLVFGLETADECHLRFTRAVHAVLDCHGGKTIAIVAHGTVISLFVSRLTGTSVFRLWNELGLPSFVVLDINSKWIVAKENIT